MYGVYFDTALRVSELKRQACIAFHSRASYPKRDVNQPH